MPLTRASIFRCSSADGILEAAILGFEAQRERLAEQIAELRVMLDGRPSESTATSEAPKGKRRKMSAAGRARIAAAQRKRWAKLKGESSKATSPSRTSELNRDSRVGTSPELRRLGSGGRIKPAHSVRK